MSIFDGFVNRLADTMIERLALDKNELKVNYDYYYGNQKKQLKISRGKTDDNIILNFISLVVNRSVSKLFHGGIKFKLPDGSEAQAKYLKDLWDANKQQILLFELGLYGSIYGTVAVKMQPDGIVDFYDPNKTYTRLITINPEYLTIITDPQDKDKVNQYIIQYQVDDVKYREVTRRTTPEDIGKKTLDSITWMVEDFQSSYATQNQWQLISSVNWPYDFPPILHWKNMPTVNDVYGQSDIGEIISIQDKNNFIASNIAKIIRLHAHPQLWGRNINANELKAVELGPDKIITVQGQDAALNNLEMNSDLGSSRAFFTDLRQALFDIAREVDITSITDKIGSLTNFGLRVLYSDSLAKSDTKRQLYGDAITEMNRRLLVLAGYEGEASRPGEIIWQDTLPVNILEKLQAQQTELAMGTVSKQTIAEENGRDWEQEKTRISSEQAEGGNIGAAILKEPSLDLTKAFVRSAPQTITRGPKAK